MTAKQLAYLFAMMMVTGLPAYAVAQTSGNVADKVARIERKNIIGAVLDSDGEPLAGATVMIDGTTNGWPPMPMVTSRYSPTIKTPCSSSLT